MYRRIVVYTAVIFSLLMLCAGGVSPVEGRILETSQDSKELPVKIVKHISLPKGYHEGLYNAGKTIWVSNGKRGSVWVVDKETGSIVSNIKPAGSFTEVATGFDNGDYLVSDWEEKRIYRAEFKGGILLAKSNKSFEKSHPAGAIWANGRVYVITWTRGIFGTHFVLSVMDKDFRALDEVAINEIQEPSQIAWDGRNMWISSWYDRKIYRIDVERWKINGYIFSHVGRTTGIASDGGTIWFTATHGDLYQAEFVK